MESDNYYRAIFENSCTATVLVDKDLKILMVNSKAEKLSGYSQDELIGKNPIEIFVSVEYLEIVQENYRLLRIDPDRAPQDYEIKCTNKHGQVRDCILSIAILPNSQNLVVSILDVTERNYAEEALKHQVESQALLLRISQNFTKVVPEDIDDMINSTLQQIGEFDNDDRSYVFLFSDDGCTMSDTHEWCREGVPTQIDNLQNLATDRLPWLMEKIRNLENINIPSVTQLPQEAQAEKEIFQAQSIQSLVIVPMTYESKLVGFLGFNSEKSNKIWNEDSITLLNIVANIFTNAFQHKKYIMAIREPENHYRTVFENSGSAILIIEEDMTISKASREWERSFGYSSEELEGSKWPDLFTDEFREKMKKYHCKRRIDSTRVPTRYNSRIRDKAGKVKDCLVIVDIIPGTKRSVLSCIDLSEINRTNRALRAISAVNMTLLHAENEQSLLENVCQNIVGIGGYLLAWVSYVGNDAEQTILPIAHAGYDESFLQTLALKCSEGANGPTSIAIRTGRFIICRNIQTDPMFAHWRTVSIKHGLKATITIPLIVNGERPLGALCICSEEEDIFNNEEVKLLTEMAGDLAYGITSIRIRSERNLIAQKLEISLEKTKRMLIQTVDSLATSLETRDPYTADHQRMVTSLAVAIAKEMGLLDGQIEGISVAGTLHDIGKMIVPSEILSKPGKISNAEFMLIKSHCQAGYDIIKNIEFPWQVSEVVLQHHERINGSGYPQGLTGDEILLEAKILAVADVVEAITSHRPYRPSLGIDVALAEISNNKCILYDPEVVDTCLGLFQEKGLTLEILRTLA